VSNYLAGLLAIVSLNVILAYAVFLSTSVGVINLGTAGFAAIGAYTAAYLNAVHGVPVAVAVASGAGLAALVGFFVAFPILRTQGVYIVLATFAFAEFATGVIINLNVVGGASGYPVKTFLPVEVLVAVAVGVALLVALAYGTRFGLTVRAVHDDDAVARLFGVNVRMTKVTGLAASAALAGVAGGLYGFHYSYLEVQSFNDTYSIYVLLYVLLGGIQTVWGPLAGALIFSLLPEVLRGSNEWRYVIFGAAIVFMMIFRPEGVVTRKSVRLGAER
jgi:branched-chain amino acid transport system permease protein